MENAYSKTLFILKKYNISANKKLGQNFLINDEVIEKIVESACISKDDLVIEIGPGLGTLTEELLNNAKKVIAIELDKRMIQILNDRFSLYDNFELINEDVLKVDLKNIIRNEKENNNIKNVKIVANLPYYITTPIIMKLIEEKLDIESITVMVQKEVAKRLTASPGDRLSGAITYSINYYCETEEITIVPNSSFIPEPEVESEVIKLNLRKNPEVKPVDEELFFKLIKVSFMQRRKTLLNGITNGKLLDKEQCKQIFLKLGLNENIRGEALTLDQFAQLSNEISKF